jgi:hypothetical protein
MRNADEWIRSLIRCPTKCSNALYFLATEKHLKEKLDAERTYATGAQSLLKLIERRKAEWGEKCHTQ